MESYYHLRPIPNPIGPQLLTAGLLKPYWGLIGSLLVEAFPGDT